jgi:hypothetical protein
VYLNGVLLKLTDDYTAANGSDIVLTSGAATGDILEFITFADFTVNNQNFTGGLTVDNDGSTVLTVDRATSDGAIIDLQKSGSSVGSIASSGGTDLAIGSGDTGFRFIASANEIIPWNASGNTTNGDAIDIGKDSQRFKDLYLSGGVYLGGTGAANKLDDYEEGTWTPTNSESVSLSMSASSYQKIGNTVHIDAFINIGANSSGGSVVFGGLPFALGSGVYSVGVFNNKSEELYAFLNSDGIQIRDSSNVTKTFAQMSALFVGFQISYIAA